jgi:hypothetical protein
VTWSGYVPRAAGWSLAAYLAWRLAEPVTTPLLGGMVDAVLALARRPLEVDIRRASPGAVLFLALYLAHAFPLRRTVPGVLAGVAVCLGTEAVAIAVLAALPRHEGFGARLARSLATGGDRASPFVAWMILAHDRLLPPRRPAGTDGGAGAKRRRERRPSG